MPSRSIGGYRGWGKPIADTKARLLEKCVMQDRGYTTHCLIWTGIDKDRYGYGRIKHQGRYVPAHYVLLLPESKWHTGRRDEGLEVDHLCYQTDCVRPTHLEWVTKSENAKRRRSHGRARSVGEDEG